MKRFMLAMLLLGAALLGTVLYRTDLAEVWSQLQELGWGGLGLVFLVFLVGHLSLAASWLLTLPELPVTPAWLYRIWKVLMVGSALEMSTPLAGLGGEPVKAILLKRHHGIRVRDASASLLLTRMTDLFAQIVFISLGLVLLFRAGVLPPALRLGAAAGLALFTLAIVLFLLLQTQRGFSRLRGWLERGWLGTRLGERALSALEALHDIEDRVVAFYARQRLRCLLSSACAFGEWMANAFAVYLAVNFLGQRIGFDDALVIESFVGLVRSTLFFVPADLGTQEVALVTICGAVTGSPETGLALAAIRRARDLLWVAWGLGIGGGFALRRRVLREAATLTASELAPRPFQTEASAEGRSARLPR